MKQNSAQEDSLRTASAAASDSEKSLPTESTSDTGIVAANVESSVQRSKSVKLKRSQSCSGILQSFMDQLSEEQTSSGDSPGREEGEHLKDSFTDFVRLHREMHKGAFKRSPALSSVQNTSAAFNSPRNMTESDELFVPAYSVGYTREAQKQDKCNDPEKHNSNNQEALQTKVTEDPSGLPDVKFRRISPLDRDRNWQSTKSSIKERLAFMFNNELMADVHFLMVLGKDLDQNIVIPAHRFVLSISSSVFDAMFNGQLSDPSAEDVTIEITDIEPAAFLNLLRFFYTDQVTLCPETVMATLYAAKKYAATLLEIACVDYLKKNLNGDNACMLLAQARLFDEPQLAALCLEVIDRSTAEAVSAESFTEIDYETLCIILQRDSLEIKESNLYSSVLRWAQAECSRQNVSATPENQRKVLDRALELIRFPLMSVEEFANGPAQSNLLSDRELVQMFLYFTAKPTPSVSFHDTPRSCPSTKEESVCRFGRVEKRWGYSGHTDRIRFTANRKVFLVGFGLYGSINGTAKYFANIQLLNSDLRLVLGENDAIYSTDGTSSTFKVAFKEPVEILPNVSYTACATIQGPDSYYGSRGMRRVVNGKTMFQFFYNAGNNNGTSVEDGQIPVLYFCTWNEFAFNRRVHLTN